MPIVARTAPLISALDAPGVAARAGALAATHGRAALRRVREGGYVRAVLPHIYTHHTHADAFATRVSAAMEWLPASVALTGLAACVVYGLVEHEPAHLRASAPSPLHVRSPEWLTLRRCVRPSATHEQNGARVVSVPEALVHAWEEDPLGGAREAMFTALKEGLTSVAEIRAALDYYPRVRGRWRLRAFLAHLLDGMHSYLEYQGARRVLNTPDLMGLEYQTRFVIEGNVFFTDRFERRTRTVVEFDGERWHGTPDARAYDAWRDSMFARIGIHTERITYWEVMHEPARSRAKVRAAIVSRAGPP